MLDKIASGWSIFHERRWFEAAYENPENQDSFGMFKESVVEVIVSPSNHFPVTLANDQDRLLALQQEFRLYQYGTACGYAFTNTLRQLGWTGEPPTWSRIQCMQRVWAVVAGQKEGLSLKSHPDIVLEIVRMAFTVCSIPALPDSRTLAFTTWYHRQALDERTALYQRIKGRLRDDLLHLVHSEVEAIFDMSPLGILNHYDPSPPGLPANSQRAGDLNLLESIARRTAHVLVLHWRVWAPILYNQPDPEQSPAEKPITLTEVEEMAERRRSRSTDSSTAAASKGMPEQTIQHQSQTGSISPSSTGSQSSGRGTTSVGEGSRQKEKSKARSRTPSI